MTLNRIALPVHIAIGEYRMTVNRISLSVHIAIGEYRMLSNRGIHNLR